MRKGSTSDNGIYKNTIKHFHGNQMSLVVH